MADEGLSFTDRLTNLFQSSNNERPSQTIADTLNQTLTILENFTTPAPASTFQETLDYYLNQTFQTSESLKFNFTTTSTPDWESETQYDKDIVTANISFRVFYSFALILISILGIFGNILVVVSILKDPALNCSKEPTNALLFNLGVSDLITLSVGSCFAVVGTILGRSPLNPLTCRIQGSIVLATFIASLCTIAAMSMERFADANWKAKYPRFLTKESLITASLISWIPGLITGIYVIADKGWIHHDRNVGICILDFTASTPNPITLSTLTFALLFIIPSSLLLLLNFFTLCVYGLKRFQNQVRKTAPPPPPRARCLSTNNDDYFLQNSYPLDLPTQPLGMLNQLRAVIIKPRGASSNPESLQTMESLRNELFTKVEARATRHGFGSMTPVQEELDESEFELKQPPVQSQEIQLKKAGNKERAVSLITVILVYLLLALPAAILCITSLSVPPPSWTMSLTMFLYFAASTLKPIIYFYSRTYFRTAFINYSSKFFHCSSCCSLDEEN